MLEQTKWLQLSLPLSKKAHALAKIRTRVPDQDQNKQNNDALDHSAMNWRVRQNFEWSMFFFITCGLTLHSILICLEKNSIEIDLKSSLKTGVIFLFCDFISSY